MILHGAIRLWWQAKTAREIFLTVCLIWHSINKSECKVELKVDNFFDAICLIIFHYFTLGWKWRFFCVNETTWNAFTTGSFKYKANLQKSACIDNNSFACCFFRFFERCDVIVTHYFIKVKCFPFFTLPKLASYSDSICCMMWFCSGGVKSCFIKKKWWWRTRRTWYRVKFWWWKVRIGKAICI